MTRDTTTTALRPSRLRRSDAVRLGIAGLRARPARLTLSALGIAIGIAAMIAVVGISSSSRAALDAELDRLGTNLLRAAPSDRDPVPLPANAAVRVERLPGVEAAAGYAELPGAVDRNDLIERRGASAVSLGTADPGLIELLGGTMALGSAHRADGLGTVVLGSLAADRLGVDGLGVRIAVGQTRYTVVGILEGLQLAPDLDTVVFLDQGTARATGWDGRPTTLFERSDDASVDTVRAALPGTLAPGRPGTVSMSRPSDALAAREATDTAFTGMLVGLSGVALLVGGIGVANTMVIAVLERRREIGLRRALGATRRHIRTQFVLEAVLLSLVGGALGAAIGSGVVLAVALGNGWAFTVPPSSYAIAIAATVAIGAIAGALPALRAARTPPTTALSS